jgi:hypothetical protein
MVAKSTVEIISLQNLRIHFLHRHDPKCAAHKAEITYSLQNLTATRNKGHDHPERVQYKNFMLNKSDEGFLRHILFTHEATFYSNSHNNHHIHRIWGAEEPDKASECMCDIHKLNAHQYHPLLQKTPLWVTFTSTCQN